MLKCEVFLEMQSVFFRTIEMQNVFFRTIEMQSVFFRTIEMQSNLDLRFLLFYCLFVKFFSAPFRFFDLLIYCFFSFFDLVFYCPLFSRPFFFALVLSLFFWLMWFHL
jgi:hypothetical protein